VSQREVDQAQNEHAAAEFDLRTAEGTLTSARNRLRVIIGRETAEVERVERERVINPLITINAQIDGTIIGRKIGPGQYVRSDAGDALYAIADLSTMWLKANVPEFDSPLVRVGQEIEVRVTALPGRIFKARITAIGASSDAATRRVMVRLEIPNPDRALKSEMFASFKISIGEWRAHAWRSGRSRDLGGRCRRRLGRAGADGLPAPQGEGRVGAGRTLADQRRPRGRRPRRRSRRDLLAE
jgi:cobalt-zinc-cadmium efflux system membrane fusion protein